MKRMTQEAYVAAGGAKCPCCAGTAFYGGGVLIEEGKAIQDITCQDCEASWNDVYILDSYVLMEEGTQP